MDKTYNHIQCQAEIARATWEFADLILILEDSAIMFFAISKQALSYLWDDNCS